MPSKLHNAIFTLLLLFQATAPLPAPWEHWLYSRSIELPPAEAAHLVSVTVPVEIYGHAQSQQADLRVIDDNGQEVPYVLYAKQRVEQRQWRNAKLEDLGYVAAGQYTHAIVDVGENPEPHNSIVLDSPETNFFAWVEVAASDDHRTWRVLRDRAPIYRFRQDTLEGNQVVTYPESRARYLRLHISLQEDKPFQLDGCRVTQEVIEEAERVALPVSGVADASAPAQQSWWRFDLGARDVPVSEARFETSSAPFHRAVQVSASNDGKEWWLVGSGEIYRLKTLSKTLSLPAQAGGAEGLSKTDQQPAPQLAGQEVLRVEFSEVLTRHLRVAVFNRNDPPLEGLTVAVYGTPRHVVFNQQPGRRYRLLYGNVMAKRPEYELARLVNSKQMEAAAAGGLGAEESNPNWSDPRPWTEKHPWVLWAALGLAVVVLGGLALRSLRTSS